MFSDDEIEIQQQLWGLGIVEMSLKSYEAKEFIAQLEELLEEGVSDAERIVIHFSSTTCVASAKWDKTKVQRINQMLEMTTELPTRHMFYPDRIINARQLLQFYDLTRGKIPM
jgi:hypothetical protein